MPHLSIPLSVTSIHHILGIKLYNPLGDLKCLEVLFVSCGLDAHLKLTQHFWATVCDSRWKVALCSWVQLYFAVMSFL
jgi:hypothetical protein